ncbi:complex I subunit 5 family protein [Marinospirillum alkaliphilum]|uniref:Multicomponent Na+:H+ antiporter subunit D n=1 Tax=Marinospirillum alkaliphilum DSM 21637 TaxID=1122209 RepID=A0A1K1YCX7_9GAMM|nr:proton-conducting transporter membrane subunit [Marinospirillum alkaliphilum]SFX59849.1 multicomponent Na+:H+ antiporter subunit D [Marinospirillum alkaliphilum DSM 21637]
MMDLHFWLPVLVLFTSLGAAAIIFWLDENNSRMRSSINLAAAGIKILLVIWILVGVSQGEVYETRFTLLTGIDFVLRADALGVMFAGLSSLLWLFTTLYAIGYLEGTPNRRRFFGFFSLCVASTLGIAFAGNLFTFLIFYELLTLSTYPLVVHKGTDKALRAGRLYLIYTLGGGVVLLAGVLWMHSLAGDLSFAATGQLDALLPEQASTLKWIFLLLIGGLAVKAAMVPLHGWLPEAMVAPAPVSALLHAVAVVKAGAFGIVRVVYDVYGITLSYQLGLLLPLGIAAAITILYGSLRALAQQDIKRRLAFSTVSQVSYIALGISLFGPAGTIGGLVHLLHQGLMKVTLFFCAGNYAETLGIHKIQQLNGAGRRMPGTSLAFTIGALGMIGLPPIAGFISKWYLATGALHADMDWVLLVLILSSLMNAGYFLPLLYRIWFCPQQGEWPQERVLGRWDTSLWLLIPPLVTASLSLLAGLLAASDFSPLAWVQLVTTREYLP